MKKSYASILGRRLDVWRLTLLGTVGRRLRLLTAVGRLVQAERPSGAVEDRRLPGGPIAADDTGAV
jgi:hypothetical protein